VRTALTITDLLIAASLAAASDLAADLTVSQRDRDRDVGQR
jgi:hypothetical protein